MHIFQSHVSGPPSPENRAKKPILRDMNNNFEIYNIVCERDPRHPARARNAASRDGTKYVRRDVYNILNNNILCIL